VAVDVADQGASPIRQSSAEGLRRVADVEEDVIRMGAVGDLSPVVANGNNLDIYAVTLAEVVYLLVNTNAVAHDDFNVVVVAQNEVESALQLSGRATVARAKKTDNTV